MKISKLLNKTGLYVSLVSLLFVSIQAPAMAAMVGAPELLQQAELQTQRDDVREIIARDDVRAALLQYGVSADDVDARIDNLSSGELQQIQTQFADMPAGSGVLGIILGIILILVLLDVLGATDVFPNL